MRWHYEIRDLASLPRVLAGWLAQWAARGPSISDRAVT